ncbi:dihydrodipicolinate synthase family protein [Streptosporangium pseudovulgare]|uniref:Dihydrodipicolinate synthase family protein n=1 Tax=Streptosporangium pseudovulgare TaxID=35765 RepID=A0ABQ2R9L7_9ACTN|nr:dihydrodipicolinate synthase family protein [Streptosporangium pseudovulgare]GGQ14731.1 dihydrodipicolinate synthase family protein [Streptosporangium pseudovulgare]
MSIDLLRAGTVIPAHPLALTEGRTLDERRQRALTRYYLASGAGGVAVAVHTTQFEIRQAGLLRPVLEISAEVVAKETDRPFVMVAGACGDTAQAVAEAELAASLGYHAVLLSPKVPGAGEPELLERARAVGEVLPVIGFYLQEAVGGRRLSPSFWSSLSEQESLVAIKMAPFDRYRTVDVVRAVAASGRGDDIALYTGNDDNILADLLTPVAGRRIVGGLLGQWAVWTRAAVLMFEEVRRAWAGDDEVLRSLLGRAADLIDANGAVFDVAGGFRGCIAGVHEVLRGQGLLAGTWCLDPLEGLSPGQAEEIARVRAAYPWLSDDDFVAARLDDWLR